MTVSIEQRFSRFLLATLAAALVCGAPPLADESGDAAQSLSTLQVRVRGIKSDKGSIAFQLFDSKERYETRTDPLRSGFRSIENRSCNWTMTDLSSGDYVLLLYHDRNGNRELDKRAFGIPKEPYGFSNNARASFGPPAYEQIRFPVSGPLTVVEIDLN